MKNLTFSICFFIKKSKLLKNDKAPLFMRITINGCRWETSLKVGVEPQRWDAKKERSRGSDKNSILVNETIDVSRFKVQKIRLNLEKDDKQINIHSVKNLFTEKHKVDRTIVKLFEQHNNNCIPKIGTQITQATYQKYITCLKHFKEFLLKEYNARDIPVSDIDKELFSRFELFLRKDKSCTNNTAVKYIRNFNKIVLLAVDKGWLMRSPYKDVGFKIEEIEKPFLSQEELNNIKEKVIELPRLDIIRDIFVFCCYTGLAFSDVKELSQDNIVIGIDHRKWISKHRKKTSVISRIPLLDEPQRLIEKYKDNPLCIVKNTLLLVPSNQKMNAYLKELATICEIKKVLTTHVARRTFATTIMLRNGVNMEAVSKMLGHRSLEMTRKYARVDDFFIAMETDKISDKFKKIGS
ncbi:MAG TPA: site-specific integrase [Bacteroidales bacterium]|nr:site-specific integrase [Bacteroidales bacterium]